MCEFSGRSGTSRCSKLGLSPILQTLRNTSAIKIKEDNEMTEQAQSIVNRLSQAGSPLHRRSWEQNNGYYVATCRISPADIPQLIEIACQWRDWRDENSDNVGDSEDIELLPITAWRTLADLKCTESVEPLIGMLCDLEYGDDWSLEELPHVFGKIGKPAIASLVRLANDAEKLSFVRIIAAEGLRRVAEYHPESRDQVVAHLTVMMTNAAETEIELNSSVLVALVELQAVEAAEAIERAFSGNRLDVGMIGDWEEVRKRFGVEGLRLEMPKHPFNSIAQFRTRMGIGIFSDEPIFDEGERETEAEQAYYERAGTLFSKSKEAEQVVECVGELQWLKMFLEFGIQYRGEIVDEMTLASVKEFVFDHVPRKVSAKAESAASLILELTKFWEYVDRVFDLPAAKSIIEWLNTDGLADQLETEMADPANFGIAKSFVMAGIAAGYDMTSQQDITKFMAVFNRSRQLPTAVSPSGKFVSGQPRVGRNDPCPCGSGKKFKKCCHRGS
jgi:hypothetical protein